MAKPYVPSLSICRFLGRAFMLLGSDRKIVFIGDSITDCGRRGAAAPLGDGYVSLVNSLLMARYPALKPTIVNRGVGGDTVRDL
jgi:lysophospholipase L1-like esterase